MGKISYSKIVKRVLGVLIILVVFAYIVPIPINKEISAVEVKLNDPSYLETRTINIRGKYYLNLFTDNKFKGQITIAEYQKTTQEMLSLEFMRNTGRDAPLEYVSVIEDNHKEYFAFGKILSKSFLNNMVILVYNKNQKQSGWSSLNGYCIVTEAKTYEESLKILNKYKIYEN